ncbi:hypothetical protein CBR_g41374 [Chara braunii]|uniref:Uncharacterized protein n=1 Tax=Chara braunii TaxID=69332 RepID=A0A388LVW4_CHABU|nr:hypothetical protein CBR_g41374 [Chara braunii]|eukprot:GBG86379.1 hypothetical protein CBR_g41374 [Chara braunii]
MSYCVCLGEEVEDVVVEFGGFGGHDAKNLFELQVSKRSCSILLLRWVLTTSLSLEEGATTLPRVTTT